MKDREIAAIEEAGSKLPKAAAGRELGVVLKEVKEKLGVADGPVVGRQVTKLRNCLNSLQKTLWDKHKCLKEEKENVKDCMKVLDVLWFVYSKGKKPGWDWVERGLNHVCQMCNILRAISFHKRYEEGLEKAWEAYNLLIELVGQGNNCDEIELVKAQDASPECLKREGIGTLVFALLGQYICFNGEAGMGREMVQLKGSVYNLEGWSELMSRDEARNRYRYIAYGIQRCLVCSVDLREKEAIELLMMHIDMGRKWKELEGDYSVTYSVSSVPKKLLGTVGGEACRRLLCENADDRLTYEFVDYLAVEIVRCVKNSKVATEAHLFVKALLKLDLSHSELYRCRPHLCAIGALCMHYHNVGQYISKVMDLKDFKRGLKIFDAKEYEAHEDWLSFKRGLRCASDVARFLLDKQTDYLKNLNDQGLSVIKSLVDILKLPLKALNTPETFKHCHQEGGKNENQMVLFGSILLSYQLTCHISMSQDYLVGGLTVYHNILELMTDCKCPENDFMSSAWMLINLARKLHSLGKSVAAGQAYLGACYMYLKTTPTRDDKSCSVINLLHCSWTLRDTLRECGTHDLDSELSSFRDVVVRVVFGGWGLPYTHSTIVQDLVILDASVKCSPTGCITEHSLQIPGWRDHLKSICNIAWMEIRAVNNNCFGANKNIASSLASICDRVSSEKDRKSTAFLGRMQVLCGVAAGLSGNCSEFQSKMKSGQLTLQAVLNEFEGLERGHLMESLLCSHFSYALMCASQGLKQSFEDGQEEREAEEGLPHWWSESAESLEAGLKILETNSLDFEEHGVFDGQFLCNMIASTANLTGAMGLVNAELHLKVVLGMMVKAGLLKGMPPRQKDMFNTFGDCLWLGHCESFEMQNAALREDENSGSGSLSALMLKIQARMGEGTDPDGHSWLSAFSEMESDLDNYKCVAGFHSRIHLQMIAARAFLGLGHTVMSLQHADKAWRLANSLYRKEFPELGSPSVRSTFMGGQWNILRETISTALLQAEVQEALGMPKEAQWPLDHAAKVAAAVNAYPFLTAATLQRASIKIEKGLLDEARKDISEAFKSLGLFTERHQYEVMMARYLEAWCLQTEGRLLEETNSSLSLKDALTLYQKAKECLGGISPYGCMKWPVLALQLSLDSWVARCQHALDAMDPAQDVCRESLAHMLNVEGICEHISMDTLSSIYQASRICRKALSSGRHDAGNVGVFFGVRSSCRKSLVEIFQDVDLSADSSSQIDEEASNRMDWSRNINGRVNMVEWAIQALSHSTLGSPFYIQVMLLCWNGFQQLPRQLHNASLDLCAALAEGGKLNAALYFLFHSMSPGIQLRSLASSNPDSGRVGEFLMHSEFEFRTDSFDLEALELECTNRLKALVSNLPCGTSALAIGHHPWNRCLLIGRYTLHRAPVLVMLPPVYKMGENQEDQGVLNLHAIMKSLNDVLEGQEKLFNGKDNLSSNKDVLRVWWDNRKKLDTSLGELLEDVDTHCLSAWSWLLSAEVDDPKIQELLVEASGQFVNSVTRCVPGTTEAMVLMELIRLVYMRADSMSFEEVTEAAQMLCGIVGSQNGEVLKAEIANGRRLVWGLCGSLDSDNMEDSDGLLNSETEPKTAQRRGVRMSMMQTNRTPSNSVLESQKPAYSSEPHLMMANPNMQPQKLLEESFRNSPPRLSSILVLNPTIQLFPWENCPSLVDQTFHRVPNLSLACESAKKYFLQAEGSPRSRVPGVDLESTYYIINPDNDLPSLAEFEDKFQKILTWKGVANEVPRWTDVSAALQSYDMYIYFGHGAGEGFINLKELKKIKCRSSGMIMGCNSGRLWDCGRYESSGIVLNFLMGGCPVVMGNLWMVSDSDINKFSQAVLDSWTNSGKEEDTMLLASSVPAGRLSCKLRYLAGAAPVCYGIPIKVKGLKNGSQQKSGASEVIDLT